MATILSSLRRFLDQAFAEHARVARCVGLGLDLRAGDDVEAVDAVILVVGGLGRRIALALLGDDVHQDRALPGIAHVAQHGQQHVEIVAVDRADVIEAQLLEQRAAGPQRARHLLGAGGAALPGLGQDLGELLGDVAQVQVGAARGDARQIVGERADGRRDRHVVVVEDDDQALVAGAGIVHGLVGHAGAHGAVADHAHDVVGAAGQVARHRHAEAGRDGRGGMRGAERIVFALGALGEAGQAAALAQGADALAPAGQDLVRVGLVADVPDQPVARRLEHAVQGNRQLDHAEPGAEMAARHRDRVDRLLPQLVDELAQVLLGQGCADPPASAPGREWASWRWRSLAIVPMLLRQSVMRARRGQHARSRAVTQL